MNPAINRRSRNELAIEHDAKQSRVRFTGHMRLGYFSKFIGAQCIQSEVNFRRSSEVVAAITGTFDVTARHGHFRHHEMVHFASVQIIGHELSPGHEFCTFRHKFITLWVSQAKFQLGHLRDGFAGVIAVCLRKARNLDDDFIFAGSLNHRLGNTKFIDTPAHDLLRFSQLLFVNSKRIPFLIQLRFNLHDKLSSTPQVETKLHFANRILLNTGENLSVYLCLLFVCWISPKRLLGLFSFNSPQLFRDAISLARKHLSQINITDGGHPCFKSKLISFTEFFAGLFELSNNGIMIALGGLVEFVDHVFALRRVPFAQRPDREDCDEQEAAECGLFLHEENLVVIFY